MDAFWHTRLGMSRCVEGIRDYILTVILTFAFMVVRSFAGVKKRRAKGGMRKDRVYFGRDMLEQALKEADLSPKQVQAKLRISSSTWNRWLKDGHMPLGYVTDLVLLLGLPEPEDLPPEVPDAGWQVVDRLERSVAQQKELLERVAQIESHLGLGRDGARSG